MSDTTQAGQGDSRESGEHEPTLRSRSGLVLLAGMVTLSCAFALGSNELGGRLGLPELALRSNAGLLLLAAWVWTCNRVLVGPRARRALAALFVLLDLGVLIACTRLGAALALPGFDLWGMDGVVLAVLNLWAFERAVDGKRRALTSFAARTGLPAARVEELAGHCVLALLLVGLFAHRAWLSVALGTPFTTPDSPSYLAPALSDPVLPLSEIRTLGVPWLCSLGLALWGNLSGVLALHNLLWAASTALLVFTLRARMRLGALPWLVFLYLSLTQKNLSFELTLMSEHPSRCLYTLYFAVLVRCWGECRTRTTLALTGLTIANVLVKPTAIVLVPITGLAYLMFRLRDPRLPWRTVLRQVALAVALVIAFQAAYASAYAVRFGRFATSAFTGSALFSQVGHLVDLDAPTHLELKAELRRILPRYVTSYVSRGVHEPNWLVFGSLDDRLRRDFGDLSPGRSVREYVVRHRDPARTFQQQLDDLFKELAVEGIRAHPGSYLSLACSDFVRLFRDGLGPFYGGTIDDIRSAGPHACGHGSPPALRLHREVVVREVRHAYVIAGAQPPDTAALLGRAHGPLPLPRGPAELSRHLTEMSLSFSTFIAELWSRWRVGWVLFAMLPLAWLVRREHGDALRLATLLLVTAAAYGALLALVCISEVARFVANVQDLVFLALAIVGWVELRAVDDLVARGTRSAPEAVNVPPLPPRDEDPRAEGPEVGRSDPVVAAGAEVGSPEADSQDCDPLAGR